MKIHSPTIRGTATISTDLSVDGGIVNSALKTALDGYATITSVAGLNSTVSDHYNQHSDAIQTILKDLDGYGGVDPGLQTTVDEHYVQHSDAIQTILKELDGYSGSDPGLQTTVDEHYAQHSDAIQSILKDLDGYVNPDLSSYAVNATVDEHYAQHSDAIQTILKDLDGYVNPDLSSYAVNTTVDEHYTQHSQAIQTILKDLDGYVNPDLSSYAVNATVDEHYAQHSDAIQTILKDLDGYVNPDLSSYAVNTTVDEHYVQHSKAIQTILKDLDGYVNPDLSSYAVNTTVDEHYTQHSDAIQSILKDLDGYATAVSVSGLDTTFSEHYAQHSEVIQNILKDLDGYVNPDLSSYAVNATVDEHYAQHSEAIQTILKDLDGYVNPDLSSYAVNTTVDEHYTQHGDAIQTILKDLDGYVSTDGYATISGLGFTNGVGIIPITNYKVGKDALSYNQLTIDTDGSSWEEPRLYARFKNSAGHFCTVNIEDRGNLNSFKTEYSQTIQDITGALDGYVNPDLSGYAVNATVDEHYAQHSEVIQTILKDLDGYVNPDLSSYAVNTTVDEHYAQHSSAIQTILKDLDGYVNPDLSSYALDTTVSDHYTQHSDAIQTILKDLDGYVNPDLSGYAANTTVDEHYAQHSEAIQTILKDLDGYVNPDLSGYASDTTVSEHYAQHSEAIQTILKDLDGYVNPDLSSYAVNATVDEHYAQHSQAIQTILKDLDGYATDLTGVSEETFNEFKSQYSQVVQSVRQACDGYIGTTDGYFTGNVSPNVNNTQNLGMGDKAWHELHIGNGGINLHTNVTTDEYTYQTPTLIDRYAGSESGNDGHEVYRLNAKYNIALLGGPIAFYNEDLYISDYSNQCIRRVRNSDGYSETWAGKAGIAGNKLGCHRTSCEFNGPTSIAFRSDGSAIIADFGNHNILTVNPATGVVTKIGGDNTTDGNPPADGTDAYGQPMGGTLTVIVDTDDNIICTAYSVAAIFKITATTNKVYKLAGTYGSHGSTGDGGAATAAKINHPMSVAITSTAATWYIMDTSNSKIRAISSAGIISTFDSGLIPYGSWLDETDLYSGGNGYVYRYPAGVIGAKTTIAGNGATGQTGDGGLPTSATIGPVGGLCMDEIHQVYIQSSANQNVRVLNSYKHTVTTEGDLNICQSGIEGATGSGWVQCNLNGMDCYIRLYSTK